MKTFRKDSRWGLAMVDQDLGMAFASRMDFVLCNIEIYTDMLMTFCAFVKIQGSSMHDQKQCQTGAYCLVSFILNYRISTYKFAWSQWFSFLIYLQLHQAQFTISLTGKCVVF